MAKATKTKTANTLVTAPPPVTSEVLIPQGWQVFAWGIIGLLFGSAPAIMLLPGIAGLMSPWTVFLPIGWACLIGLPITYAWSNSLYKRIAVLRVHLNDIDGLTPDEQAQYPGRLPWLPAWIGIFERAFYSLLIGLDVAGGAAFIGVWVGLKSAGGWQIWSKGTTYGRAIFFTSLLGNAMSVLFGVVAGLVIRFYTMPATP